MANKNEQTVQETVTKSEAFFDKNKKAIAYGVIAILAVRSISAWSSMTRLLTVMALAMQDSLR